MMKLNKTLMMAPDRKNGVYPDHRNETASDDGPGFKEIRSLCKWSSFTIYEADDDGPAGTTGFTMSFRVQGVNALSAKPLKPRARPYSLNTYVHSNTSESRQAFEAARVVARRFQVHVSGTRIATSLSD